MWESVCGGEEKEADFVAWLSRLLHENQSPKYFETHQDVAFIKSLTIKCLYEVLNVRQTHNIEFQTFLSLMQEAAEEMGYMQLYEED
mmetsp:Transcript_43705/g.31865  ORF Transcript_43705/g.31865 Transcript_43705/m.31865 type:complete len:87 (+) Transcript_43705:330-590(+)